MHLSENAGMRAFFAGMSAFLPANAGKSVQFNLHFYLPENAGVFCRMPAFLPANAVKFAQFNLHFYLPENAGLPNYMNI